jgi:hypothetical protein
MTQLIPVTILTGRASYITLIVVIITIVFIVSKEGKEMTDRKKERN